MALAIDSQETGNAGHRFPVANPSGSWSFTNTAGNLLIVGAVATDASSAVTVSGVTYNGVSMTSAATVSWDSGKSQAAIFYLVNPPTGAHTVVVTPSLTGLNAILAGAISFSGADTTTPIGTTSSGNYGSTLGTHAQAGSITAASGNYLFSVGGWGSGGAATPDQTRTFTLTGSGNTGGDDIEGDVALSSGSAINMGFTWASNDAWGIVAAEIKAASGGAVSIPALTMAPMAAS